MNESVSYDVSSDEEFPQRDDSIELGRSFINNEMIYNNNMERIRIVARDYDTPEMKCVKTIVGIFIIITILYILRWLN
jgi:hypothetical protein